MEAALHAGSFLAAERHQPLSENSRLGYQLSTVALHPGIGFVNSNTATGLRVCLYDAGRGSRCTGKERDPESGLDYFGARYYGSALGRFSSPDEPLADQYVGDPQSWNLYGYVRNNPLKNVDPFGLDCITTSNQSSSGVTVTTERGGSAESCSGTYVNGTVDTSSYSYSGSSLSFSDNTAGGGGAINFVSPAVSNEDFGISVVRSVGARTDASYKLMGVFAAGSLAGGGVFAGGLGLTGSGLVNLGLQGAARAAALSLPAGAKLAQMIARGGGQFAQNPAGFLSYARDFVANAVQQGTYAAANQIGEAGATIYRVGNDYLVVANSGRILSSVPNATPGVGVVTAYYQAGGR